MIYYINGISHEVPDLRHEEDQEQYVKDYWTKNSEACLIVAEIRKRYDINAEFAIHRQKDEKPEEYAEYYAYCEQCKAYVKKMRAQYFQ